MHETSGNRDWLSPAHQSRMTWMCERGLVAASGILWQQLGHIAAGNLSDFGQDHLDPARSIIAEYLRHTGRDQEANEVAAIGSNTRPPATGFDHLTETQISGLRDAMTG